MANDDYIELGWSEAQVHTINTTTVEEEKLNVRHRGQLATKVKQEVTNNYRNRKTWTHEGNKREKTKKEQNNTLKELSKVHNQKWSQDI